jgi:hypothetical protein
MYTLCDHVYNMTVACYVRLVARHVKPRQHALLMRPCFGPQGVLLDQWFELRGKDGETVCSELGMPAELRLRLSYGPADGVVENVSLALVYVFLCADHTRTYACISIYECEYICMRTTGHLSYIPLT